MIDEKQINEAIAYYSGKLDPSRGDAVVLAACYSLRDHLCPTTSNTAFGHSYAAGQPDKSNAVNGGNTTVGDYGNSEFLQTVKGKRPENVWAVVDELMQTLSVVNPRVYNSVMRKIKGEA